MRGAVLRCQRRNLAAGQATVGVHEEQHRDRDRHDDADAAGELADQDDREHHDVREDCVREVVLHQFEAGLDRIDRREVALDQYHRGEHCEQRDHDGADDDDAADRRRDADQQVRDDERADVARLEERADGDGLTVGDVEDTADERRRDHRGHNQQHDGTDDEQHEGQGHRAAADVRGTGDVAVFVNLVAAACRRREQRRQGEEIDDQTEDAEDRTVDQRRDQKRCGVLGELVPRPRESVADAVRRASRTIARSGRRVSRPTALIAACGRRRRVRAPTRRRRGWIASRRGRRMPSG